MNKLKLVLLLLLFIGMSCKSPNNNGDTVSSNYHFITINLDNYFLALTKLKRFNGVVLIQKNDEIILYKAYNMDKVNSSLYVSKNSQFDIHSISKLMAKSCIVKLEKADLIRREYYVSKYIPDFPKGNLISIQNLLDNQSGLPRELSEEPDNLIELRPKEFIDLIKREKLLFSPGTETLYSNLGYQLIYFIISEITNKPFVQYLKDEIFDPFGMNESGAHFYMNKENLTQPVKNHINDDGEIKVVPNFEKTSKNQSKVYSSVENLLRFINEMKKEPYWFSPLLIRLIKNG